MLFGQMPSTQMPPLLEVVLGSVGVHHKSQPSPGVGVERAEKRIAKHRDMMRARDARLPELPPTRQQQRAEQRAHEKQAITNAKKLARNVKMKGGSAAVKTFDDAKLVLEAFS